MKKLVLTVFGFAAFALAAQTVPDAAAFEAAVNGGWKQLMAKNWSPKTGLIYGCTPDRVQPAADFKDGLLKWCNGSPFGYGRGMGDCAIVNGVALSMLCDKHAVTKDPAAAEDAKKIAIGLLNLASAHGYKGFVARGLCQEDGKSICSLSSRDQVTHWVHGLWRYCRSGLADGETKARFAALLADVAEMMLKNVTAENDWDFLQADGSSDPRGICKMWGAVYPHEAARLPMIYAAAWEVTGDGKWKELYERYIDEALAKTLAIKDQPPIHWHGVMPTYSLLQMNTSLEVLLGIEKNPARRSKMAEAAACAARMADERAMDMKANPKKKYYGLCVDGEIALAQLLAPGWKYSADERGYLAAGLSRPLAGSGAFNVSHMAAAYWRARLNGVF